MDIERLKKLNILAGELRNQGIAQNHEDAALLAVTMVGGEEEQCLSDMHINEDQSLMMKEILKEKLNVKIEVKNAVPAENPQPLPVKQGISTEEVENILQSFVNTLVHEFNALQQKVEKSNVQVAQLVQQINTLQVLQQKENAKDTIQEQVPVQRVIPRQTEFAAAPVAGNSTNPRTGNFATDDVCIEKMFYFGMKK